MTYRMMKTSFTNQDGEAEDNEIITGIRQKDIRQDDKPEEKNKRN